MKAFIAIFLITLLSSNYCLENARVFRQYEEFEIDLIEEYTKNIEIRGIGALDFAAAFVKGLQIFSGFPSENKCTYDSADVVTTFVDIYKAVSKINLSSTAEVIKILVSKISSIMTLLGRIVECKAYALEIAPVFAQLSNYFKAAGYFKRMFNHALHAILEITAQVAYIVDAFINKDYGDAGAALGKIIKFIILFDFKYIPVLNLK